MSDFKPLYDNENYEATETRTDIANRPGKAPMSDTFEAPCESEDGLPMKADIHHRPAHTVKQPPLRSK